MTEADIAKHNTDKDCYVVIDGNVLDVKLSEGPSWGQEGDHALRREGRHGRVRDAPPAEGDQEVRHRHRRCEAGWLYRLWEEQDRHVNNEIEIFKARGGGPKSRGELREIR